MLTPALALTLLACGGAQHTGQVGTVSDPTAGICQRVPTGARAPDTILASAEDALQRGCMREALEHLESLARSSPAANAGHRAFHLLIRSEVAAKVTVRAVVGEGEGWTTEEQKEPLFRPLDRSFMAALPELAGALARGALPADVRDDGRLAALLIRGSETATCETKIAAAIPAEQMRAMGARTRAMVLERHRAQLLGKETGGMWRALALEMLWSCKLDDMAKALDKAATQLAAEGRPDQALAVQLERWELGVFPGGHAASLGLFSFGEGQLRREAALIEANLDRAGPRRALARDGGARLDKLVAAAPAKALTPALRAQIAYLRAALAYYAGGEPAVTARLAARAMTAALAARRSDLLDAARVIALLDAGERDDVPTQRALSAVLLASLRQRAAIGARLQVAIQIATVSKLLQQRGRTDSAISLLQAVRDHAGELGALEGFLAIATLPKLLLEVGRFEEGAEEARRALAQLRTPASNPVAKQLVGQLIALLRGTLTEAEEVLGDTESALEHADIDEAALPGALAAVRAWQDGDLGPLADMMLRPSSNEQNMAKVLMTTSLGMCRIAGDDLGRVGSFFLDAWHELGQANYQEADSEQGLQLAQAKLGIMAQAKGLSMQLLGCGASLARVDVVEIGRKLGRLLDDADGVDADREALFDAARAEAEGRYREAADGYLAAIRGFMARASLQAGTGVGAAQLAESYFTRAAIALLKAGDVERAMEVLEESRARDLRAMRSAAASAAKAGGGPLGELSAIEARIDGAQRQLRALTELGAASVGGRRATLEAEVARLQAERDRIARRVASANPTAYRAAALAHPPSLAEIRRHLGKDQTLIYYLLGVEEAFALVVDQRRAQVVALQAANAQGVPVLAPRLARYRALIRRQISGERGLNESADPDADANVDIDRDAGERRSVERQLYMLLVEPLETLVPAGRRVLIVPDASMSDLPLAMLGGDDAPWIARNPLRILPGAFLLADEAPARGGQRIALVGDPAFSGASKPAGARGAIAGARWARLPGTRAEALAIGKLFGATPLLEANATEAKVRSALAGADVIHLATHGLADVRRPAYSALILATPRPGERDDGLLYAYEVERLRLHARVVVLSACETGKGQARGGEGVLALDRSFLIAGAGAVVSSLWRVDDASTSALMQAFHLGLRAGKPADVALAAAMNQVRKRPGWQDGRYWGAFRVVGAGAR